MAQHGADRVGEFGFATRWVICAPREVISKLSKQAQQGDDKKGKKGEKDIYIPWRDSKLTRLLQVRTFGKLCCPTIILRLSDLCC